MGHNAIGFDADPLAVAMSRVWATGVVAGDVRREAASVLAEALQLDLRVAKLPWVRDDSETASFIHYWFAPQQRRSLQRIAFALHRRRKCHLGARRRAALEFLAVALSRIIVTKDQGASLARDVSHSRPHKVADDSHYDVIEGFERSVESLLARTPAVMEGVANVTLGDARCLPLPSSSIDAVLTSPPYLNAIDYMRGHRMSLVWLGYRLNELRRIRAASVGAERYGSLSGSGVDRVSSAMLSGSTVPRRFQMMVRRYAEDLLSISTEISRVLRKNGQATLVVGNSCLRGSFIKNSEGVAMACRLAGLEFVTSTERELPSRSRYLPVTLTGALSKRMRTEAVLTFRRP